MNDNTVNFRPFETHINKKHALKMLENATHGADDGEIYLERSSSESLTLDEGRIKNASYNTHEGFGLRSVSGEVTGYAHSSTLSDEAVKNASDTVRLVVESNKNQISPPPQKTNQRLYAPINPVEEIAFNLKIDTLGEIDTYLRAKDPRVVQVSASLSASFQEIEILRPDGQSYIDIRPLTRMNISVIMEQNGLREAGSYGFGGRTSIQPMLDIKTWQPVADEALRIASINLDAVPAPAGEMDIVLGPGWPGILLHEAIGHGLEGDFNRKKTSAFSELMGQQIASSNVTVVDDGTLPDRRGSISFDDEGTPSARNTLIENGRLVNYMQDRQNARLVGLESTGNGRRQSYAHAPMPRMTNTYMTNGPHSKGEVVAGLKNGIYAVGFGGGQVDITSGKFVFSCTEAYHVKDGKMGPAVKGATLIGDGSTALKGIKLVGNDMTLDPGIGTCGKQGQWVPVGVGQPSLLIQGLTVGGTKT